jgi:putative oxidoreductase
MDSSVAIAWLILQLVCGLTLAAHGAQKLFGWFDGSGFAKWEQGMRSQRLHPARFWAGMNVLGELGGGLSLAFGFLTPLGAAGIFGAMFMAMVKSHWKNGFFNSKRGIEFPLSLMAISTAIGLTGPREISLDHLFGIVLPYPWLFVVLAAVAVVVDIIGIVISRPAPSAEPAPHVPS